MRRIQIFFLHNPKAGGSSLRSVLSQLCGGSVAPVFANAPNEHRATRLEIGQHRGYDFYAGHYGYQAYQALRENHLLVTNFRDPVQRIYSMYRYWRNNVALDSLAGIEPSDAKVVRLAHDLSFSKFIRSDNEDLQLYISNFHFRQLYRSGWDPLEAGTIAKWTVHRRLRNMPWFYIAETPQASELLLKQAFPEASEISISQENTSLGNAEPISPSDAEHLIRMNVLDYRLYSYALELQGARLAKARLP